MSIQLLPHSREEFCLRGEEIYQTLKNQLEGSHRGEIVAIEPESEDYFLGKDVVEATEVGRNTHPDKLFYYIRVGFPAVHRRR
ncbi:MAG: hypothetical protein ACRERD_33725 [Candidatus Binatia bacterium]